MCSTFRSRLLLLLAGALLATGTAIAEDDRAPVLLRGSQLLTPAGTTCTGIAPEVKLRVSIDARGLVTDVEALDVQPSSDLDEIFRRTTVDKVRTWRFAPAVKDGKPTPTELSWSVQFKPKEGFVPNPALRSAENTILQVQDAAQRRIATSLLSFEQRQELLSCYSSVAEKYIDVSTRQRFDSANFVIISDSPQEGAAGIIANNLEATSALLTQIFQPAMALQDTQLKYVAYVFRTRAALHQTIRQLGVASPWNGGFYLPPGFFLFHLELKSDEELLHLLLHEGFHAYADQRLARPGLSLPLWMEEGFAEYLSNSKIKKGQLIPGKTPRRKFVILPYWGVEKKTTDPGWSVKLVQKAVSQGEAIRVVDLLHAAPPRFFGTARTLFYSTSWLFVHFLRHDNGDDVADERFAALTLYLAEGYPPQEAMETVYGANIEEIDKRFQSYVRRF